MSEMLQLNNFHQVVPNQRYRALHCLEFSPVISTFCGSLKSEAVLPTLSKNVPEKMAEKQMLPIKTCLPKMGLT